MDTILEEIKKAENAAKKQIESAHHHADLDIKKAKEAAEKRVQEAEEASLNDSRSKIQEALQAMDKEREHILEKASRDAAALEKRSSKNKEAALKIILERFEEQC